MNSIAYDRLAKTIPVSSEGFRRSHRRVPARGGSWRFPAALEPMGRRLYQGEGSEASSCVGSSDGAGGRAYKRSAKFTRCRVGSTSA